ncbi:MAG: glucokinase [Halieaceae bacterium]|nr:glucokinase [Halieaceae bacterium]
MSARARSDSILGSAAGNLVLTLGARGVYLAGGIVPRHVALLEKSSFRYRFEDKGRYKIYMKKIPTRVVERSDTGLIRASGGLSVSI